MKFTYEQLRHLASLGDPSGQLTVKNRKGKVVRPTVKTWGHETPKAMHSMSTREPQKQSHAHTAHPLQTYQRASSLQLQRPQGKR